MSTKHVRTAADLIRFKTALQIRCEKCGNATTMTGFDVPKAFGPAELQSIQGRLNWGLCGAKCAGLTVLSPPAPRN